jgi:GNAT superfamily N-acetyltransferase
MRVQELSIAQRLTAAPLLVESLAGYYALLGVPEHDLILALAAEMAEIGTELENGIALVEADGALIGIFCGYPAEEVEARQIAGTFHLVSMVDAALGPHILSASARHAARIQRVPRDTYYMARMGIVPTYRGNGVSTFFYGIAREAAAGRPLSLHVEARNIGAVRLHRREGLDLIGPSDCPFLCMTGF